MKRITQFLFAAICVSVFLVACSSGKNAIAPRGDFKGSWQITSARLQGAEGNLNITAFDDADLKCFEGSQWYLPNNGYGNYTINASGCAGGARQILWSQRVSGGATYFNFKKMDGIKKSDSKNIAEGYSMEVTSFEKDKFTARSPVNFEGRTVYIIYDFERR